MCGNGARTQRAEANALHQSIIGQGEGRERAAVRLARFSNHGRDGKSKYPKKGIPSLEYINSPSRTCLIGKGASESSKIGRVGFIWIVCRSLQLEDRGGCTERLYRGRSLTIPAASATVVDPTHIRDRSLSSVTTEMTVENQIAPSPHTHSEYPIGPNLKRVAVPLVNLSFRLRPSVDPSLFTFPVVPIPVSHDTPHPRGPAPLSKQCPPAIAQSSLVCVRYAVSWRGTNPLPWMIQTDHQTPTTTRMRLDRTTSSLSCVYYNRGTTESYDYDSPRKIFALVQRITFAWEPPTPNIQSRHTTPPQSYPIIFYHPRQRDREEKQKTDVS